MNCFVLWFVQSMLRQRPTKFKVNPTCSNKNHMLSLLFILTPPPPKCDIWQQNAVKLRLSMCLIARPMLSCSYLQNTWISIYYTLLSSLEYITAWLATINFNTNLENESYSAYILSLHLDLEYFILFETAYILFLHHEIEYIILFETKSPKCGWIVLSKQWF